MTLRSLVDNNVFFLSQQVGSLQTVLYAQLTSNATNVLFNLFNSISRLNRCYWERAARLHIKICKCF